MKKRIIAALLAGTMVTGLLAGCGGQSGEESESGGGGDTINILMEDVADTTIVQNHIDEFTEETGIEVNIETIGYSSMHEKLLTQMISDTNAYDVVVVDCYWVGEFTQAGWLEDLGPYIEESG